MKRWYYFALAGVVIGGAVYVYTHWTSLGLSHFLGGNSDSDTQPKASHVDWRTVERPDDGIKVDMPAEAKDLQAPAYNEAGGTEPVKMLVATPDSDTAFSVSWEDNPPVARVSRTPERTLNMARDGMLARTRTTLLTETRGLQRGNPSLDITARNPDGGVLDARLIYAGTRLYLLTAMYPSATARRERDVKRFFNSFTPTLSATIPETVPSATQN